MSTVHEGDAPDVGADRIGKRRPPGHSRLDTLFPWLLLFAVGVPVALLWGRLVSYYGDSDGYLNFAVEATATYPLFLDAVTALFGSVAAAPNIQLALAAAALAFCGLALRRALDAPLAALILVAFLGGWPHLAWLHSKVLTDSLFVSCCCVLIGALALLLRRPVWRNAALVSLACGLAITVRPAGASLAPLLPIALWLIWRQRIGTRWPVIAALILPAALCIWAENVAWRVHHDDASRPSRANLNLYSKVLLMSPAPVLTDPDLAAAIAYARELMAPGRALVESAPSLLVKIHLLCQLHGSMHVQEDHAYARATKPLLKAVAAARGLRLLDLQGEVAREALMVQPAAWLGDALLHYWGQWSSYWIMFDCSAESGCRDHVEGLARQPLFADAGLLPSAAEVAVTRHWRLPTVLWDWAFKWMMLASFAASFVAIGLASWQRLRRGSADRDLGLAALCGLAVHGHFLLCGLFSITNDRYTYAMLPMAAVCGMLLVRWARHRVGSVIQPK